MVVGAKLCHFGSLIFLVFLIFFPQSFISACRTFLFKGGKIPEIGVCNVNCDLTFMLALITVCWNSCALRNTDYDKSSSGVEQENRKKYTYKELFTEVWDWKSRKFRRITGALRELLVIWGMFLVLSGMFWCCDGCCGTLRDVFGAGQWSHPDFPGEMAAASAGKLLRWWG